MVRRALFALYLGDVADVDVLKTIFIENDIQAIIRFAGSAVVPASSPRSALLLRQQFRKDARADERGAIDAGIRQLLLRLRPPFTARRRPPIQSGKMRRSIRKTPMASRS